MLALTAYLAASRPAGPIPRDGLLPLFWPELDETSARHALSQALSVMRSELGDRVLNSKYRRTIELDPQRLWCDVRAFREAGSDGRHSEALDLYGGPLLDGFFLRQAPDFEEWLESERSRLARAAASAAIELARTATAEGDWTEGRGWAERAIALDPYAEPAWRALIRCLEGSGDAAGALLAYERMARRFGADLGIEPSDDTRALVESIRSPSPGRAQPPPEPDAMSDGEAGGATEPGVGPEPLDPDGPIDIRQSRPAPPDSTPTRRPRLGPLQPTGATLGLLIIVALAIATAAWFSRSSAVDEVGSVRSLVVLPLDDLSVVEGEEYFADALTAELGHELSRIEGLAVTSHRSAQQYKGAGQSLPAIAGELHVDAVLEGQVQRQDSLVRIMLQLVDGRRDRRVWSGEYEGLLDDVLAFQREVAAAVAGAIRASWAPASAEPMQAIDPQAYDAYLRGLYHLERYNTDEAEVAIGYFEHSIGIEPAFAPAHAGLARACVWSWNENVRPGSSLTERCETAAREAIQLDETLGEAHAALGFVLLRKLMFGLDPMWDWRAAEQEFREAIRLNPSSARAYEDYAELLRFTRRFDEARAAIERARQLDPLSLGVLLRVGIQYLQERRFDEALAVWDEIQTIDGTYATAHYARGATFIAMERPEDVLAEADEVARRLGEDHIWVRDLRSLGYALAGKRESALAFAVHPSTGELDLLILAGVHLILGDTTETLDNLEQALEQNAGELPNLTASLRFDALRAHPRFVAIREAIGLQ
ncbi:MAG: BTAD domain-containing putative transcriptional regulator [Gemmatimonadales bacterium]